MDRFTRRVSACAVSTGIAAGAALAEAADEAGAGFWAHPVSARRAQRKSGTILTSMVCGIDGWPGISPKGYGYS